MQFIALLHPPQAGSLWGVTFPDLPGCTSSGRSFEEASRNASEALRGHFTAMRADGDRVPSSRTLNQLQADPEAIDELDDAFPLLVDEQRLSERAF